MRQVDTDYEVIGDLGGEKIEMRIDPTAFGKLIGILTDLYSDPILACIREYSTNAWDAHMEAGNFEPIRVSTPTQLSPYFVVSDSGIGMSVDDVRDTYSLYGASTKTDTDDLNGMLGLGSKSALTYTNQFTVIAVKNGVKTIVAVQRVGDGKIIMEVVDTSWTNDPDGVEIRIPTKFSDYSEFQSKAKHFFSFWKPGTVLLDGVDPSVNGDLLIDDHRLYVRDDLDGDYVVMGNIPYPVNNLIGDRYTRRFHKNYGVVAHVEMGSEEAIEFTPNREAMIESSRTTRAMRLISQRLQDNLVDAITQQIANAENRYEALRMNAEAITRFGTLSRPTTYNGEPIPSFVVLHVRSWDTAATRHSVATHHVRFTGAETERNRIILVKDYDGNALNSGRKAKIKEWAKQNSIQFRNIYFLMSKVENNAEWLDGVKFYSWNDIAATKMPRQQSNRTYRESIPLLAWKGDKSWMTNYQDLDEDETIVFCGPKEIPSASIRLLTSLMPDVTLVLLGKNRWDKLRREVDGAMHVKDLAKKRYLEWRKTVTEDQRTALSIDRHWAAAWRAFEIDAFHDPQLNHAVKVAHEAKAVDDLRSADDSWANLRWSVLDGEYLPLQIRGNLVDTSNLKYYPLISEYGIRTADPDHVVLYVNAVYDRKEKADEV